MIASTAALFGGVFVADALTGGAPAIDYWAYGSFLILSMLSLGVLGIGGDERVGAPKEAVTPAD